MQCVDVLKQIAGDDRDTEHQLTAPANYTQTQVTLRPHSKQSKACYLSFPNDTESLL